MKVALVRMRLHGSTVPAIASTLSVVVLFDLVAGTALLLAVCLTGAVPFARCSLGSPAPSGDRRGRAGGAVGGLPGRSPPARSVRRLRDQVARGGAILRTPRRYACQVVAVQAGAWACRIGVVYCLLAAFGLEPGVARAALVMVLCGVSTLVPLTPGGAGTQQVMLAFALSNIAAASVVVSFSVGMQAGVTAVNALLGLAAGMVAFGTMHPLRAVRSGLRVARAPGVD